jgi:hypothetical protein
MISERDQKFLVFWDEKRKQGRWKYAFRQGVLIFAWPVYLMSELFRFAMKRSDYVFSWSQCTFTSCQLSTTLPAEASAWAAAKLHTANCILFYWLLGTGARIVL